jgi:hypothetical protein
MSISDSLKAIANRIRRRSRKVLVHMREATVNPELFGNILRDESWFGWKVLLIAAAGEELTPDERIEYKRLTGRDKEPGRMCKELICIFGRRAGKTTAMTVFAIWISCLCDHSDVLAVGETGVALLISRDQRVARIILERAYEIMLQSPPLRSMIINKTADSIVLNNHCTMEVRPCSYATLRGPTYILIVCDELAQWFTSTDFANPDIEVLTAVRGGTLTTRAPTLMVSSTYSKHGVLYDRYKKYFSPNGPDDIVVAFGTCFDLNPSLPRDEIQRDIESDPARFRAEYLSEWRDDHGGFIGREIVERNVRDYIELLPQPGIIYRCFIDQASGVDGGDSFVIVIGHKVGTRVVVDVIREIRPPFDFFEVVNTVLVPLCRRYRIYKVTGDNYAGELAKAPIRKAGIGFDLAQKHKSELYSDPFVGMLNSAGIDLPKHERAIVQICQLERTMLRTGREQITHPSGGHDDIANAIAGLVDLVLNTSGYTLEPFMPDFVDLDRRQPAEQQKPAIPPEAYYGTAQWHKAMPRQPETYSANDRLASLYRGLDRGFKNGF